MSSHAVVIDVYTFFFFFFFFFFFRIVNVMAMGYGLRLGLMVTIMLSARFSIWGYDGVSTEDVLEGDSCPGEGTDVLHSHLFRGAA